MPVAGSARQYALHFNLSNAFFKRKFKIELSGNYQAGVDDCAADRFYRCNAAVDTTSASFFFTRW
jgi:hypothetical protein